MSKIVVQKYGGSSVATSMHMKSVASLIKKRADTSDRICVVVSAMGKTTDNLFEQAREISKNPNSRELDMLLSSGERISMSLLAMALWELGLPSISLTGSQAGIITDDVHYSAKIIEIRPAKVMEELEAGKIVIVAGFQGVSRKNEITTLGRGGSDTTAVAMAAALGAHSCEIYSDVEGVFTCDPRIIPSAQVIEHMNYEQMSYLSAAGAKVLDTQAIQFAQENNVVIHARKTHDENPGTIVSSFTPRKSVVAIAMEKQLTSVIARNEDAADDLCRTLASKGFYARAMCPEFSHKDMQGFLCVFSDDAKNMIVEHVRSNPKDYDFVPNQSTISLVANRRERAPLLLLDAIKLLKANQIPVTFCFCTHLRATIIMHANWCDRSMKILHTALIGDQNSHADASGGRLQQ